MDKTNEEYRQLEKEYEYLSNLINDYRSSNSLHKEGLKNVPRKSSASVAKGSAVKESQSQYAASISQANRPQQSNSVTHQIKPLEYFAASKNSQLNPQTLDKGHQRIGKNIGCGERLCVVNKYKLVRPHGENSLCQVQPSIPRGSQFSQAHADSINENRVKSSSSLSDSARSLDKCHSTKDVVVHKSKYKLVKSDKGMADVNMTKLKSSPQNLGKIIRPRSRPLSSATGFSASANLVTASVVSPCKTPNRNAQVGFGAHHQMRKRNKFPANSAPLNGQLLRGVHTVNSSYKTYFSSSKPKGSWTGKYSLQRRHGEVSKQDNCINMILGRKVSNLSSNKYKFINAKPIESSKPSVEYTNKRKRFTSEGLSSSKATRFSWRPKGRLAVRRWNCSDVRHPVKRKKHFQHASAANPSGDATLHYCLYYNRFGRCSRGDQCQYIHDPDKISVCTRFLRGTCKITDCLFSHKVAKHKMPTCRFFLRRACHREDCPYSHVNVGKDAEICLDFLRGFCTSGDSCRKKHMLICPDSDSGACPRGSRCPMRHPKKQQKPFVNKTAMTEPQCNLAPADKQKSVTAVNAPRDTVESSLSDDDDVTLEWKERRLPSFIALENSFENSFLGDSGNSKSLIIHPRLKTHDAHIEMVDSIIQQSSQDL